MKVANKIDFSVLMPTYKRAHLVRHVLTGLVNQTFKNFEVLVILKPSGDGTEAVIEEYRKNLNIRLVLQKQGFLIDALNLGFKLARGRVIALIDDDAIPFPDWLEKHMEAYKDPKIGGVAGNVVPLLLRGRQILPIQGRNSEVIPEYKPFNGGFRFKIWNQPVEGLENCLVYISKAGLVEYNTAISSVAQTHSVASLLGMGANMSVLAETVRDFIYPSSWINGLANEQFLGWHVWRQGYKLVFYPAAKVNHLLHGQSLSRTIGTAKTDVLSWTENNLLFYRLYGQEPGLSAIHRVAWLIFDALANIKKFCVNKDFSQLARLKSKFYSELIGLKWILSRRLGLHYSPIVDLKKLCKV
jgi:glycosyltransferase involved in cell wall biosynthesis